MIARGGIAMIARAWLGLALLLLGLAAAAAPGATDDPRPFDARSLEAIRRTHAGRPFVLSLWSVHCEPCAREMPLWRELRARYPGVPVVLVATDGPPELDRIRTFLRRNDPGPVEHWRYADEFEERIRFAIDPKWRGELPRTYFHDAAHKVEAVSGMPDAKWIENWFSRMARQGPSAR
ncbi:MAG TPA: TlpA disulfide reductase family protein [Usitatibacteraceae bacterium]|nr:TlpA disulfide reductase family protein [Usitatibacteraceae bacterium]